MNTPTGTPADPRTDQGSNKPTRPPVRLLSRQQEQRSQLRRASGRQRAAPGAGSSQPGTATPGTVDSTTARGASTQPAGARSFMTAPLSLDTIDSPPTPKPPTTGDAPEGAPPPRPIEHGGQTVTRSRSYQYASTGSTLSTNITTSRS